MSIFLIGNGRGIGGTVLYPDLVLVGNKAIVCLRIDQRTEEGTHDKSRVTRLTKRIYNVIWNSDDTSLRTPEGYGDLGSVTGR